MIELSISLAKSGQKVVVRPHPSESVEVWKKKTEKYSKHIKIIRSGNIIPWLMASKIVIHNGCTTAVEGFLLDKTIISFRPIKNPNIETDLPNAISICLETKEDVVNYVNNFVLDKPNIIDTTLMNILRKSVKINQSSNDSTNKILKLIENIPQKKKISKLETLKNNIFVEIALLKLKIAKILNKKNFSYFESKCSKLDVVNTKKVLDIFFENKIGHRKIESSKISKYSLIISSK